MYCGPQPEVFRDLPPRPLLRVERKIDDFPTTTRTLKACPFLNIATLDEGELVCFHC